MSRIETTEERALEFAGLGQSVVVNVHAQLREALHDGIELCLPRIEELEAALRGTAACLAAAVSLLERGGRKAAASDLMFDAMLTDYRNTLEEARAVLKVKRTP